MRTDLLRLSPEALAQLANVGLVKRAVRELAGGYVPTLTLDDAATLTATFSDGVVMAWPVDCGLRDTRCSCGAAGVCRHRIMAVLAYREQAEQAPPPMDSPGSVGDDALAALVPPQLLALARRQANDGVSVDVRRLAAGEPCPTARLPMATVHFWGGSATQAARCDCIQSTCCEHVAMAVWAFRQADATAPDAPTVRVHLGPPESGTRVDPTPYRALVASICRYGVTRGTSPHVQALSAAIADADARGAVWLRLVLADLETWLDGYQRRSAAYEATRGVDLVAELTLRLAAGARPGMARTALGVGEAGRVELDRLRLVCLGCRIDADGDQRHARMILADTDTSSHFVLDHHWTVPAGPAADEHAALAAQRVAPGVGLVALAGGQLLSQQASRAADGRLHLARARRTQNNLLPQNGDWSALKPPLQFQRVADALREHKAHPSAHVGPRHAASRFAVLRIRRVERLFYDPNEQVLAALVMDEADEAFILKREHRGHVRHALDALAGALNGHFGPPTHVAGPLGWVHGQLVLEPWAVACDRVVVPDIEPACAALADTPLGFAGVSHQDPLAERLHALVTAVGDLLHHGAAHLGGHGWQRLDQLVSSLRTQSLDALAMAVAAFNEQARLAAAAPAGDEPAGAAMQLAALAALHRDALAVTD